MMSILQLKEKNMLNFITYIPSLFFAIFLSILVWVKGSKKEINRVFSMIILFVAIWVFITLMADAVVITPPNNIIWARMTILGPLLMLPTLLYFSLVFPKRSKKIPIWQLLLIFLPTFSLIPFSLTSLNIVSTTHQSWGGEIQPGPVYLLFDVYFVFYLFICIFALNRKYISSIGSTKGQLRYILLGISITSMISITVSGILPIFGISRLSIFGPPSALIFLAFTAYAIIKHRLLEIRLIISRSLIYGVLVGLVAFSFIFALSLSTQKFGDSKLSRYSLSFLAAVIIVFALDPLKRLLSKSTDRIFYKAKVDYNVLIQQISEGLSVEIDIDRIIENVSKALQSKLKLRSVMIVLRQDEVGKNQSFVTRTTAGTKAQKFSIAANGTLVRYIEKNRISILEALERKIDDTNDEHEKAELVESRQELESVGAALAAPVVARGKMNALLLLGPKLSGDSFGTEDIRLIEVISPQIASAIEKAKLYDEVKSFSERMKLKVEEATKELKERNISLLTLQRITKDITRSLDFNIIVQNIADSLSTELGYLGGILVFLDDDGRTARARAITQTVLTKRAMKLLPKPFDQFPSDLNDPSYNNMEAHVLRTGKMMVTDKIHDIVCPPLPRLVADGMQKMLNVNTIMVIPILSEEKVIGVMEVGTRRISSEVTQRDVDTLQSIADQLGIIYRNIRLFDQIRKANDELAEANTHLKQLDQAKSEFVSIASHQLRTPMTGIMGYLSMMTSGDFGKVKPEHQKILQNLLEESQRMIRLINLFLNVSKIEAGKFQINKTEVHIENLVEREIRELKKIATDKALKLNYIPPKQALPTILADADKIQDVLLNLIDNAIKYTAKGSVTVTVEASPKEIRVNVADTGIGIKPEDAKELFNKFVRGPQIAQIHPDGSGLGLFIAKSIIEGHSGKIWVESNGEGKGSTFSFTVPLDGGHHGTTVKI